MTELLPWLAPVTDGIVMCKDSGLLAAFEFVGVDADSAGEVEAYQLAQAHERMLGIVRGRPLTLWWTVRRERVDNYPAMPMPTPVGQLLDDENRATFTASAAFVNRHFVSVLLVPERSASGAFEKLGALMGDGYSLPHALVEVVKSYTSNRAAIAWQLAEFSQAVEEYERLLTHMGNAMSEAAFTRLRGDDLTGLLWAQANVGRTMVPKRWDGERFLDALLPERELSVARDSLVFDQGSREATHASLISMKSWPSPVEFGAFDGLLSLPSEMVLSHCFRLQSIEDSNKHIKNVRKLNDFLQYPIGSWIFAAFRGGEPSGKNQDPARAAAAAEMTQAAGEVSSGRISFGWHAFSLMLHDRDEIALEANTAAALRLFHGSPFIGAMREGMHALSAWATSLPGQWQEGRRWMTLSTANMTDLAPLQGVLSGEKTNEHLSDQMGYPAPALTVLPTDKNTAFFFNFHAGAIGHALVVGPTRSGKSIGMNFLISQFTKYPGARIIIFDKDYSCRQPTLLQDGQYIDLRPGASIKLNPMLLARERANWSFLAEWIEGLIASRGYQVTAADAKEIHEAVAHVGSKFDDPSTDPQFFRLLTVRTLLPGNLRDQLAEWVGDGQRGNIFDNLEDGFALGDFTAIEMGHVMKDPRVARAFMDYAFHRIKMRLEDQRRESSSAVTMVYVEEAWFLLASEQFTARLMDWLKTFAKLNAFVVLTTQSIEDLVDVPDAVFAALRDNVPTQLFLPNPKALSDSLAELYRRKFVLTEETVQRIATGTRRQDYVVVKPGVVRTVRLLLTPVQIALLRSDIKAQRVFERHWRDGSPMDGWQQSYLDEMLDAARA